MALGHGCHHFRIEVVRSGCFEDWRLDFGDSLHSDYGTDAGDRCTETPIRAGRWGQAAYMLNTLPHFWPEHLNLGNSLEASAAVLSDYDK